MVRLRASAVDPEVMSETGEAIVVSGFVDHIICKSKTIKVFKTHLNKAKIYTTLTSIHVQQHMPSSSLSAPT